MLCPIVPKVRVLRAKAYTYGRIWQATSLRYRILGPPIGERLGVFAGVPIRISADVVVLILTGPGFGMFQQVSERFCHHGSLYHASELVGFDRDLEIIPNR
jgi:hypothetical protein